MNLNGNILDATGLEIYSYGGPDAWHTTQYRGNNIYLEWLVGAQSTEPLLIIEPIRRGPNANPLMIALSSIGAYADQTGGAAPGALERCRDALPSMGRNAIDMEARALLDVVLRFAPDLINMPPCPAVVKQRELAVGRKVAEIQVQHEATGKIINEAAL